MDDLLGEDWRAPPKPSTTTPAVNPIAFATTHSKLTPTPPPATANVSRSSTPLTLSRPTSTVNGGKQSNNDQFGNLLSLRSQSQKAGSNLSIQARQEQLLEEKRKQQEQHAQLWETLASGRGTPQPNGQTSSIARGQEDEDDILAAFNKDVQVDNASHYPPPTSTEKQAYVAPQALLGTNTHAAGFEDDDDPFDLSSLAKSRDAIAVAPPAHTFGSDDDILGDLGKPVNTLPRKSEVLPIQSLPSGEDVEEPTDRAVAELVDMGFSLDTSMIALAENAGDVQNAVGWLLQQAHEESKQKAQKVRSGTRTRTRSPQDQGRSTQRRDVAVHDSMPTWMRQEGRSNSRPGRQETVSPANNEIDPAQVASEFGSKFFKSANSLWKASQKQMAKTVAEFQQDRDPSQPKWMLGDSGDSSRSNSQRRPEIRPASARPTVNRAVDVTDEAALLDMPREDRLSKNTRSSAIEAFAEPSPRERSPVQQLPRHQSPQPILMQQPAQQRKRPTAKLTRQEVEEQSAQAYISPARRKRTASKAASVPEPEIDLFGPAPTQATPSVLPTVASVKYSPTPPVPRPVTIPPKAKAQPRSIPAVSSTGLSTSAQHRKAGGEAFKRGDYATAHDCYTAALQPLPATHPIMIIILSNRSLTALKIGDAKTAVSDADRALALIGDSQGLSESIDLGPGDGLKDMRDFYGKALMRKAEALEHMEKWTEAAQVWRQAIAAGVGGPISLRGRDRCEKAVAPKSVELARPKPSAPVKRPPTKASGNSMQRAATSGTPAVKALRAANAAAEKADDEKFALTDQVDLKLAAWKSGKADNLRALLQSLEGVLWTEAGWKKVGMSDLVMPNKVKIVYMKAIAKVHPDKISHTATTEQRMISASVFATLNEAWDKFKRDNNL